MAENLCQLKVTLLGVEPPVWHRLVVDAGLSLKQLHQSLQAAMGWQDYHLYEFEAGGGHYGEASTGIPGVISAIKTRVSDVLPVARSKIVYVYDFGDDWRLEVSLERLLPAAAGEPHGYCLDGARAGPPEDVGGAFGYADWLEMLTGGDKSERSEAQEVLGEDFDAERFDLDVVNQRLKRASARRR